jgi:hypothetical protein
MQRSSSEEDQSNPIILPPLHCTNNENVKILVKEWGYCCLEQNTLIVDFNSPDGEKMKMIGFPEV